MPVFLLVFLGAFGLVLAAPAWLLVRRVRASGPGKRLTAANALLAFASLPFLWIVLEWPFALVQVRRQEGVAQAAIERWTFPGLAPVEPSPGDSAHVSACDVLRVWALAPFGEVPLWLLYGDGGVRWFPGAPIQQIVYYRSDVSTEDTMQRFLAAHASEGITYRRMGDDLCPTMAAERGLAPDVCQPSFNMELPTDGASTVFVMIERRLATPRNGLVGSTEVSHEYGGGVVITAVQFSYLSRP